MRITAAGRSSCEQRAGTDGGLRLEGGEADEDDKAFKARQKADAAALKDAQARAAKGGPMGGAGIKKSGKK